METSAESGWVLYDDECRFCRTWVLRMEATLRRRGFAIAPLQADWVRSRLALDDEELLDDIRLLLPGGRQIAGADVYRHCMRRIWWAWPMWVFSIAPGGRQIFDWGYRSVARNRSCAPPVSGWSGGRGG